MLNKYIRAYNEGGLNKGPPSTAAANHGPDQDGDVYGRQLPVEVVAVVVVVVVAIN